MSRLKRNEVNMRMKSVMLINWNIIIFVLVLALLLFRCESSRVGGRNENTQQIPPPPKVNEPEIEEFSLDIEITEEVVADEVYFMIDETPQIKFNTEEYSYIKENNFQLAFQEPKSTFSIDVDNASYSNLRRFLSYNQLPPKDAVRIEEMVNYFDYDYPNPNGDHPFEVVTEMSDCPWNSDNKLLHIGIQGKKLDYDEIKPSNLVFLIDVSGSMSDNNKLPLLKKSLKMLVKELQEDDKVSLVVYAGAAGVVLEPTPASESEKIINALDRLEAGGSTAGGAGIQLAYDLAIEHLKPEGNNRVILATDGDFNVGNSSTGDLVRLIEEKRKSGVYLTICGFGMGNYKDGRMEEISNAGNGNYFYIDNIREAEKVFVTQMRANMFTIAKDVKIQVEFNPLKVKAYRLIGYENRVMDNQDFEDDTKDAGELGAGHTVTALYEIVTANGETEASQQTSRYVQTVTSDQAKSNELVTLNLRYKPIKSDKSELIVKHIKDKSIAWDKTSDNYKLSAAVAGFGMLLRESEFKNELNYDKIMAMVPAKETDHERSELLSLVKSAALITAE